MLYDPAKSVFLSPNIEYLFNDEIIEYDIRDAGFSLIKQYQLLPPEKIQELEGLSKGDERHIAIGNLQRYDKELSRSLASKFAEIRTIFVSANDLNDNNIISVKKDAIFTIGTCRRTKFGVITFVPKNTYSSYVRFPDINNIEIYYSSNGMDIKGMGANAVNRHRLYMYDFLRQLIQMIESNDSKAKRFIMKFIEDYKHQQVEEEYYLEFNNRSKDINPVFNYKNLIIPMLLLVKEMEK